MTMPLRDSGQEKLQRESDASMSMTYKSWDYFVAAPDDAPLIWQALQDVWPGAVAFDYAYYRIWIDAEAAFRQSEDNPDSEVLAVPLVPPEERHLPELLDITSSKAKLITIYPSMPKWDLGTIRAAKDNRDIAKMTPGLRLDFSKGFYRTLDPFTELDKDISKIPPSPGTGDVPVSLDAGFIRAIWTKGDDVSARAVARFFRRLNKLTTNKLSRVDRTSLEVVQRIEKGGWMHVCPNALEWSRARPQNFIERQWKPIDWAPPPGAYASRHDLF